MLLRRPHLQSLISWALENPVNGGKLTAMFHSQQEGAGRRREVSSVERADVHLHEPGMRICRHQGSYALGVGLGSDAPGGSTNRGWGA